MLILIDNGHGLDTLGKRSPDGKFLEATYTREIARKVVADLIDRDYNAQLLVPEPEDIPLSERVCRINAQCNTLGKSNVIVISIHVNAAGKGSQWLNATGWSCYTSKGQTTSDLIAECFYTAAKKRTSQAKESEPISLTPIPTGKKTSTFSATPSVLQSPQRTSSWTTSQILSTCRAELVSRLWSILMWNELWSSWRSIVYIINLYKIIMYDIMSSEETSCIFSICICET